MVLNYRFISFVFIALWLLPQISRAGGPSMMRRAPVAVIPPAADTAAAQSLALVMADRAGEHLYASGRYTHFHVKQVLSYLRSRSLAPAKLRSDAMATDILTKLGARYGAWASLSSLTKGGWELVISAHDLGSKKNIRKSHRLGADSASAVMQGSLYLAQAVEDLRQKSRPLKDQTPFTSSAKAAQHYARCFQIIIGQPLGLRKTQTLDIELLKEARAQCKKATEADAAMVQAWSALSLAESLAFENDKAARSLKQADALGGYRPFRTLSRYWLTTRFKGSLAGEAVLKTARTEHPGSLIFLTYLGNHLNIVDKYQAAYEVWEHYNSLAQSPYGKTNLAYSLARLGQPKKAVELTREAQVQDPESSRLQLELASRLVDAQMFVEAEKLLTPLAKSPAASGELLLRLGYVLLLQNKNEPARQWLNRAIKRAQRPGDWRTRGRSYYDLAILSARRGDLDSAEKELLQAAREGYKVYHRLKEHPDLKALAYRPAILKALAPPESKGKPLMLFATPFPTDAVGDARPEAPRGPMPEFGF